MTRTIDDIYMNIANNIVNKIESEWKYAVIEVEMYGDAAKFKSRYFSEDLEKPFKLHHSALDDFEDLQKITTKGGSNKWNRAKFTLSPSGEFEIDFEWDQDLADEIESNS